MVKVFKPTKKRQNRAAQQTVNEIVIDTLDHEAQGVAKISPVTFVKGALPGEHCKISVTRKSKSVQHAHVLQVLKPHSSRVEPRCSHFSECGGCQTQYIEPENLLPMKQDAVSQMLAKFSGIDADSIPWLDTVTGDNSGYRRKARLAVDARDNKSFKLGFRGRTDNQVIPIQNCLVLEPALQKLIHPLRELLPLLSIRKTIGHVSLFQGDSVPVVVIRLSAAQISDGDEVELKGFVQNQYCSVLLQFDDNFTRYIGDNTDALSYTLAIDNSEAIKLNLEADSFVQVNAGVNQKMLDRALDWLDLQTEDTVLDLFCGIGNFTLPISRFCLHVVGFEGSSEMVQLAKQNASINGIENASFVSGDLTSDSVLKKLAKTNFNKVLLDPARSGAREAIEAVSIHKPDRLVYVSCNPATFGRDIAVLLNTDYDLEKICLLDMFPYTAHTEIMALFIRK